MIRFFFLDAHAVTSQSIVMEKYRINTTLMALAENVFIAFIFSFNNRWITSIKVEYSN